MIRWQPAVLILTGVACFVGIIAFLAGWSLAQQPAVPTPAAVRSGTPPGAYATAADVAQFAVLHDVRALLDDEFYRTDPLDQQQLTYGAIRGMLATLDDEYTIFEEPDDTARTRDVLSGRFEGIGVYMRVEHGQVLITRPIKESPAMQAGVQAGDVIVAIDGILLADVLHDQRDADSMGTVSGLLRGPKGSEVVLTLERAGEPAPFDLAIVRDEVPLFSVYHQMLPDDIGYIQITEFKANTARELDAALLALQQQQMRALVLDVRNNPGGFLTTAQEVLGRFYNGIALYEEKNTTTTIEMQTIASPAGVQAFDVPLLVLLDEGSASAAEIVAGALRVERADTLLLGATSFGKGSVQNIHRLSDGSSVRITVAHWFTPDGAAIHEVGITPDYLVPAVSDARYAVPCTETTTPPDGSASCTDAQLYYALRLLTNGEEPPPLAAEPDALTVE